MYGPLQPLERLDVVCRRPARPPLTLTLGWLHQTSVGRLVARAVGGGGGGELYI